MTKLDRSIGRMKTTTKAETNAKIGLETYLKIQTEALEKSRGRDSSRCK